MNFTTTQNGGTIPLEQRRGIMDEVVVPNRPRGRHSKGGRNKLPSGEKAITISVSLPPELHAFIIEYATTNNLSVSKAVATALQLLKN